MGLENLPNLNRLHARESRVDPGASGSQDPSGSAIGTSDMDTSNPFFSPGYSGAHPSGLDLKRPTDLEEGEISHHSSLPEPMDQAETLGHGTHSAGSIASDTGATPGRISDFQSEDMDTTAQPSEVESYSDQPMTSQDVRYACSHPDSDWGGWRKRGVQSSSHVS